MINLTENAVKQLQALAPGAGGARGQGLRIFVEHGGCAGLQYGMQIAPAASDDLLVESGGARVFIDKASIPYLDGSTIDYEGSLTGSGFKVHNPNAARSCGCGTSFEPAGSGQTAVS